MGLFSEVKCPRCDRRYSGLRTRCPYCGARRSKKGKRAANPDNATWKLIVAILLIVILVAAVIVLVITSAKSDNNTAQTELSPSPTYAESEGVDTVEASPTAAPTPSPSPSSSVTSVKLTYLGDELTASEDTEYNYDVTLGIGETLELGYTTVPADTTEVANWTSADQNIATVINGQITGVASGNTIVTMTIGNVSVTCKVRVG